jgi:hypothetical protein
MSTECMQSFSGNRDRVLKEKIGSELDTYIERSFKPVSWEPGHLTETEKTLALGLGICRRALLSGRCKERQRPWRDLKESSHQILLVLTRNLEEVGEDDRRQSASIVTPLAAEVVRRRLGLPSMPRFETSKMAMYMCCTYKVIKK